jgi:hypothetical protein
VEIQSRRRRDHLRDLRTLAFGDFAISTDGHNANAAGQGAGNAGAITITGANIFVQNGLIAGGGYSGNFTWAATPRRSR